MDMFTLVGWTTSPATCTMLTELTDIKPSNVLVNYGPPDKQIPSVQSRPPDKQITDVQLADFGSTVHVDSRHARDGDMIGSPIFRSPEAALQMRWGTATDVWSFGAMVRYLPTYYYHPYRSFG